MVFFQQHSGALHAPLDELDQAARRGHKPEASSLCSCGDQIVVLRLTSRPRSSWPWWQIATHASTAMTTVRPRVHAFDTLSMYVWPTNFQPPAPMPGSVPRAYHKCLGLWGWLSGWCGVPAGQEGWLEWCYYCSEKCRIRSLCEDTCRVLRGHP